MPVIERFFIPTCTPAMGDILFANLQAISFYEEGETQFCSELSSTAIEEEARALKEIVVNVGFELYEGVAGVLWGYRAQCWFIGI